MVTINVPESFFSLTLSQIKTSKELADHLKATQDHNSYTPMFRNGRYGISVGFSGPSHHGQPPFFRQKLNAATLYFFNNETSETTTNVDNLWRDDIANAVLREKTIAVLLKEWDREKIQEERKAKNADKSPDLSWKNDAFLRRWGRERFPLEPEQGFLVQVFKPSKDDDGKVAINGYIFDPDLRPDLKHLVYCGQGTKSRFIESNGIMLRNIFTEDRLDRIFTKTREEVAALIDLNDHGIDKVFTAERFFNRDLPRELWKPLVAKLQKYCVEISSHPVKGTPCLMALPSKMYRSTLSAKENRVHIIAESSTPEAFQKFAGEIVLNPSPGKTVHDTKELSRD